MKVSVIIPFYHPEPPALTAARPSLRFPLDRLDRVALGYVGVIALVFLAFRFKFQPHVVDMWYHLSIAKVILESGNIPAWDWWELAPTGRPHLYPPVLHLLIAGLGRLSGGDVIEGVRWLQTTFYPLALLTTWYLARWLTGSSRIGLLAVLIASMDFMHLALMVMAIASCLVNILLPLLLVAVLTRRFWLALTLLTLICYTHLGIPYFVLAGLALFAWKRREYRRFVVGVAGLAVLLHLPWLIRVVSYHDWLYAARVDPAAPRGRLPLGPLSLLNLHLIFLPCALLALRRLTWREPRKALVLSMLIGFLPFLATYGGRFSSHTVPLWSLLAALTLQRLLPPAPTRRRLAGVLALTFVPFPLYGHFDQFVVFPSFTAPHACLMLILGRGIELGEREYDEDALALANYVTLHTSPREILHTPDPAVGDMLFVLTGRRTDAAAWWEVSKQEVTAQLKKRAEEADTGFYIAREKKKLPKVNRTVKIGRYVVGIREP
jgi:hypothetical protein